MPSVITLSRAPGLLVSVKRTLQPTSSSASSSTPSRAAMLRAGDAPRLGAADEGRASRAAGGRAGGGRPALPSACGLALQRHLQRHLGQLGGLAGAGLRHAR
jgi:hypothetical protein